MQLPVPLNSRITKLLSGLLQSIVLHEPPKPKGSDNFFLGFGERRQILFGGFVIKWWYTQHTSRLRRVLAREIRDRFVASGSVDRKAADMAVMKALKNNQLNQSILDVQSSTAGASTLFDIYSKYAVDNMLEVLWKRIHEELEDVLDDWLFMYPLRLLSCETRSFPAIDACVIRSTDEQATKTYSSEFPRLDELSLQKGVLTDNSLRLSDSETPAWLAIKVRGTDTVAFSEATQIASMVLGLLCASERVIEPGIFETCAARPNDYAALFSKNADTIQAQHCGYLFHAAFMGAAISADALKNAETWFVAFHAAPLNQRKRAKVAARWVNQAAASQHHVRFLFFFFAIDALFGERFKVEHSILDGVVKCIPEPSVVQKCEWLFELRSELVHGGAASVEGWARLERYRDHFETEPLSDIEAMACACLMKFFII